MPCPVSVLGAGGREVRVGIPGSKYTRGSGYTRGGGVGIQRGRYTRGGVHTHPPPDMGFGIPTLPPCNRLPVLATNHIWLVSR